MENDLTPVHKKELDQSTLSAYLDDLKMVTVIDHENASSQSQLSLTIKKDSEALGIHRIKRSYINGATYYRIILKEEINLGYEYVITDQLQRSVPLKMGAVVRTEEFDKKYSASEAELGAIYTNQFTDFRVWAPTATKVHLELYQTNHGMKLIPMKRVDKGVWTTRVTGDLHNQPYLYKVYVNQTWQEAVDPYARTVTINGEKGVVVDLNRTNPDRWETHKKPKQLKKAADAIIYELHVRDFSIAENSGIKNKGKYLGFTEEGIKSPNGFTAGLDYLEELGVTHIQLLPVQDFGSVDECSVKPEYNWGYDPVHFNAPEGSYSLDPANPLSRIKELKQLIMALHERGLHVILDVIYNHIYEYETSNFEKIVPGYFFRVDYAGKPSNGSGVGNDTASERMMFRKFIKESVKYWASEFQVDGFRFDLMGLHDIQTMNEVREVLDKVNPNVLIIGEGWDLNTFIGKSERAIIENANRLDKISFFNDEFRDTIKGSALSEQALGYVQGNAANQAVLKSLVGGLFDNPEQSVNYVECHDNHTLWDMLTISLPNEGEEELIKRHKLATTIVLMSQGIAFLHAGQEFFRTKQGNSNSYNAPDDINQLDWQRREKYAYYVEYVKKLIELRKSLSINGKFRFIQAEDIVGYQLKDFLFLMNNTKQTIVYQLPENQKWRLVQKGFDIDLGGLETVEINIEIPPLDTVILTN